MVSQPAKAIGRHRQLQATPVTQAAAALGLATLTPTKLSEPDFKAAVAAIDVTVAVVAAYGKIIPAWLLQWPAKGMINVHGSLLPAYRGASPIATAIANGDEQTGITMMLMNEKMDEGDILQKFETTITDSDTTSTLTQKLSELAASHIAETVEQFVAGALKPVPQPTKNVSYTKLLTSEDGRIDFESPPDNLGNLIRAFYPWPGVWGMWDGKRVKLLPDGMVQMEGKTPVSLADFRRGHPDFPLTLS